MKRWTLAMALAAGCNADSLMDETRETTSNGEIAEHGEREAPVTWEQFKSSALPDSRGGYVVDGDIPLASEQDLRDYYTSWFRSGNSLTVNRVMGADDIWAAPQRFNLTYCINAAAFGARFGEVEAAMQRAAASWNSIAAVRFQYRPDQNTTCNSTNTNVAFDVQYTTSGAFFGLAFFPSYARASRNVLIDEAAFTTTSGGRDLEGILRHELGHAIGFRHEHIWITACAGESTSDARQVTTYDVNSVMHYPQCRPSGTGGYRQSASDVVGAITLYGMSPALFAVIAG
jgi:serralysin